ncbi:hypothetical protein [Anatilimnocola floriformis]|uniref:hypothetical protein n=1 Tax=Anatilimnocola floriformis TaxID=2948575 RepID=UPI0020C22138|nr:hypothetical protein [Anatilimnocola floriformis]
MKGHKRAEHVEAPSTDSFLDVVAILVGIIIILVLVFAIEAKRNFTADALAKIPTAEIASLPDVDAATAAADDAERSVYEMKRSLADQNLELQMKAQERARLQLLVTIAEQAMAKHRDQLSAEEKEKFDLEAQRVASLKELEQLDIEALAVDHSKPVNVIPHLPTPMAKTVFGKELHFRMLGGKIVYLPWDEMIELLKADLPQKAPKLADTPRAEFSLPVMNGFAGKYIMRRFDVDVQTKMAVSRQTRVGLERFFFVQVDDPIGETIDQALSQGSQFRSRLAAPTSKGATVTLWVYPDSFDDFRVVKQELFKLGFLSAGRPLPPGHPIGASPDGSRSSAE